MPVRTYTPALSVLLTRLVDRTPGHESSSVAQPFRQIDLTPYLGTAGGVRTIKDINQPAGGFSVTFADRMHPEFGDTVYALVEPMDLIEIRATRAPQDFQGRKLPLIMRGFVSVIERSESMGNDGTPERTVTIAGQDMGKLFLINRVFFEMAILTEKGYLLDFHLQVATGIDVDALPVSDFMRQVVTRVINPKIQQLSAFADTSLTTFAVEATVPDGIVLPQLAANFDSIEIWHLCDTFADRPWNEMFIKDEESGPTFVFRPAPYKSLKDGSFIINGATDPGTISIDISDVVAITSSRTDARVANFFWVPAGVSQLDSNAELTVASLISGWPLDFSYPNNKPELFGVRKMTAGSNLYPQSITAPLNMLTKDQRSRGLGNIITWIQARGKQLMEMNHDNVAFEEGGMVVKGSETFEVGKYLTLTRGDIRSEAYISQIAHSIPPLGLWTSQIRFVRGTGFDQRNRITSGKPYVLEGRRGPAS